MTQADDHTRLKQAARELLTQLEQELERTPPATEDESKERRVRFEHLFGAKSSLLGVLVTLADVMLSLDKATAGQPTSEPLPTEPIDHVLMEDFLKRMGTVQAGSNGHDS